MSRGWSQLNVDADKIRRSALEELKGNGRLMRIAHQTESVLINMKELKRLYAHSHEYFDNENYVEHVCARRREYDKPLFTMKPSCLRG